MEAKQCQDVVKMAQLGANRANIAPRRSNKGAESEEIGASRDKMPATVLDAKQSEPKRGTLNI